VGGGGVGQALLLWRYGATNVLDRAVAFFQLAGNVSNNASCGLGTRICQLKT